MTTYANGKIPTSALTKLTTVGYLKAKEAVLYELMRVSLFLNEGFTLVPTDGDSAYRSLEAQITVFLKRYKVQWLGKGPYGDARWYKGKRYVRVTGAAAAIPGTSNHGFGTTVDFKNLGTYASAGFKLVSKHAAWFGFNNIEGRKVMEAWHWTAVPSKAEALKYTGWYHTTRSTQTYDQKGKKFKVRKENFNVKLIGVITWKGIVWGVTKSFNLHRLSHLKKGKYVAPVKPEVPGWFTVTSASLNGRSSTNTATSKNIKVTRPKGFEIYAARVVKANGIEWLVTKHGTYYAKQYTKAGRAK